MFCFFNITIMFKPNNYLNLTYKNKYRQHICVKLQGGKGGKVLLYSHLVSA